MRITFASRSEEQREAAPRANETVPGVASELPDPPAPRLVVARLLPFMVTCENVIAATYAFPRNTMPFADRRMTLTIQCHEAANYRSTLLGVGSGRGRLGALPREFSLCENHRRLYEQIDLELVQEAWSPSHTGKPIDLA